MNKKRKIRILHVFGKMDRGGAETWLMNIFRNINKDEFQFDFLVSTDEPAAYDKEIQELGGRVLNAGSPRNLLRYARNVRHLLRDHGPYDVVHSHVHHFSGIVLLLAKLSHLPVRIAHSHNDLSQGISDRLSLRGVYLRLTEWLIRRCATKGLAVSQEAGRSLFGVEWGSNPKFSLLYCGIDMSQFSPSASSSEIRNELNIPFDRFVVGHVGSFTAQKNHDFIIQIADRLVTAGLNFHLLLIGNGPEKKRIEELAARRGLNDRISFAGVREDVPQIMLRAMDVFILPSTHEGLPIVGIEAQAASLPTLVSASVTPELMIVNELVSYLPIVSPGAWVDGISALCLSPGNRNFISARREVAESPFNILCGVRCLTGIYSNLA